jgi:hypothetical protein
LSRAGPVADNAGMGEIRIRINRHVVGAAAAVSLLAAAVLWGLKFQAETEAAQWDGALGPCTRIGLFLAAVWIALPRSARSIDVPLKAVVIVAAGFVGIVLRPRLFVPVTVVVGILVFVLMPRNSASAQRQLARKYRKERTEESSSTKE